MIQILFKPSELECWHEMTSTIIEVIPLFKEILLIMWVSMGIDMSYHRYWVLYTNVNGSPLFLTLIIVYLTYDPKIVEEIMELSFFIERVILYNVVEFYPQLY